MKTIILAEKPSVARDIADVLGQFKRNQGYLENSYYIVTWAIGHLAELANSEDYHPGLKSWSRETLPIIPDQFVLRAAERTKNHWKVVKSILKGKHKEIINACDAGREGQLIFNYIYLLSKCKLPVRRLWLSETTPAAIQKAFEKLEDETKYYFLGLAAMARAQADWLVGINGTRAYTLAHKEPKEKGALSIGRVQTPALALVVERERQIRNFEPETWWEVTAAFETDSGTAYRGKWVDDNKNQRIKDESRAADIVARVKHCRGKVAEETERQEVKPPPHLVSLGDLQKQANNIFGYNAAQTLEIAQSLYERHRLITYPRTDSRHLTVDIGYTLSNRLQTLAGHYGDLVEKIIKNPVPAQGVIDDTKVSDHHAIIPTEYARSITKLTPDEYKIYDLVARNFIAGFYPPAVINHKNIITQVAEEHFITSGKTIEQVGWLQVFNTDGFESEAECGLPTELKEGIEVTAVNAASKHCKSQPPRRYTDAKLISALENASRYVDEETLKQALKKSKGVGTPATRAAIIERLITSGYIIRQGKYFVPTPKGEKVIGLVPEELRSIKLTGEWEQKLNEIELGRGNPAAFMKGIHQLIGMLVDTAFNGEREEI
ncbi:MAG: DNA topoisomerase III [Firmicutes bacterium]|nr:DNA topoisomerase III [Bacillota bacterium]